MSLQIPLATADHTAPYSYQLLDRLLTNLFDGGFRLVFLITEIYEDGKYGGALVRADDPNGFSVGWYEEISTAEFHVKGWTFLDGPSLMRNTAH